MVDLFLWAVEEGTAETVGAAGDAVSAVAREREWGLIVLLVIVVLVWFRMTVSTVMKAMHDRDKVSGEREERMIRVLVGFSETIPSLASAINDLRSWLGERFKDVDEGLGEIKAKQDSIAVQVDGHEKRIDALEHRGDGHHDGQ